MYRKRDRGEKEIGGQAEVVSRDRTRNLRKGAEGRQRGIGKERK
jgi:hypothetical protein